jgi:hypothetical protein
MLCQSDNYFSFLITGKGLPKVKYNCFDKFYRLLYKNWQAGAVTSIAKAVEA